MLVSYKNDTDTVDQVSVRGPVPVPVPVRVIWRYNMRMQTGQHSLMIAAWPTQKMIVDGGPFGIAPYTW
jgi:hypothetical protein